MQASLSYNFLWSEKHTLVMENQSKSPPAPATATSQTTSIQEEKISSPISDGCADKVRVNKLALRRIRIMEEKLKSVEAQIEFLAALLKSGSHNLPSKILITSLALTAITGKRNRTNWDNSQDEPMNESSLHQLMM